MVKKAQKAAESKAATPAGLFDSQLAATVRESAQQIWLAGLGAFSKAQAEGSKVFEALVKEGVSLQRKTQAVAEDTIGQMTGKMSAMAGEITDRAGQHWDKLEAIFEERVARALNKLGVPSHKDVQALIARIDALSQAVDQLSKAKAQPTGRATSAARKTATARKAAAKQAASRKADA
ncbi:MULTISPECIES: phasin family protein [Caldimonas]|jgi:poly(hydroxyalkanoate) granule-associated protein|uniref:phasin family protein n=1 Tax=Caldimonas TaxID=196013 RepID=UPI0003797C61|nr:phasin family protein [Caldimonas manganoxidans]MCX7659467.1 phasin family protein [Caldimonas manganoxidans]